MESKKRKRLVEPILTSKRRKVDICWDCDKAADISKLKWRRIQIKKYLDVYPEHKGKAVLAQIRKQKPDPWPAANIRAVNQLITRLQNSRGQVPVLKWDPNKPI